METAREYDLEPDSFFVGAEIFVPAVDYTNSTVQVNQPDWLFLSLSLSLCSNGLGYASVSASCCGFLGLVPLSLSRLCDASNPRDRTCPCLILPSLVDLVCILLLLPARGRRGSVLLVGGFGGGLSRARVHARCPPSEAKRHASFCTALFLRLQHTHHSLPTHENNENKVNIARPARCCHLNEKHQFWGAFLIPFSLSRTRSLPLLFPNLPQALIQATDSYLTYQMYYNGPVDSWLTSFAAWATTNPAYR